MSAANPSRCWKLRHMSSSMLERGTSMLMREAKLAPAMAPWSSSSLLLAGRKPSTCTYRENAGSAARTAGGAFCGG